jgi:chromosome partition protein MukF
MDQVDRIAAWGSARQRAWSEYFQYVHRYLRDVVRLDPTRALTQRLRDQLAGSLGKSFSLTIAGTEPIRLLRTVAPPRDRPPVVRPRAQREREPAADRGEDPQVTLEQRVQASLDGGAGALSAVTAEVTAELPSPERFLVAGRVAHAVARLARARAAIDRPWVPVGTDLEIEEWAVTALAGAAVPAAGGGQ